MLFTYDRARQYAENSLWEVQHTNQFEVVIPEYYRMILDYSKPETATDNNVLAASGITNSQNLKLAVKSISMPELSLDVEEVVLNNIPRKIPKNPKCGDATIEFYDAIGINVEKLIMDWYENIFEPRKQTFGYTKNFKTDIFVLQFSGDNTYMRAWRLMNCFPKSVSVPNFSFDSAELKIITVGFSVEYAYPLTMPEYVALMSSQYTAGGTALGIAM